MTSISQFPFIEPADEGDERVIEAPTEARDLSIIVPAFNEHSAIGNTIEQIEETLARLPILAEVIVVDDGSQDATPDIAEACGAHVIRMPENLGYGAALKTGIAASDSKFIAIIDADGTYPAERIPRLLEETAQADMVVGARPPNGANVPLLRRPAKWVLTRLASYLAGRRIPDLNSGMRIFRRSALERFVTLLPSGFSFTTTLTLCMLCTERRVRYVPIEYRERVGHSKIRPVDFFNFVILVLRTVVLFNPLRVFLPLGLLLFAAGALKFVYDIFLWNLSESAVMAMLAAIMVWSLGLLADMISRLHLGARTPR